MDSLPSPLPPGPDEEAGLTPRRSTRLPVDKTTSLSSQNAYRIEAKVGNVSSGGFMAECHEPVLIGSYVSLDIPGIGAVHAQVRWQIGSRMGGMFLDPISLVRCTWTAVKAPASPTAE